MPKLSSSVVEHRKKKNVNILKAHVAGMYILRRICGERKRVKLLVVLSEEKIGNVI